MGGEQHRSKLLPNKGRGQFSVFWKAFLAISIVMLLDTCTSILIRFVLFPEIFSEGTVTHGIYLKSFALLFISHMIVATILLLIFEIPRKRIKPRWWHLLLLAIIGYPVSIVTFLVYNILFAGFRSVTVEDFPVFNGLQYYPMVLLILLTYAVILFWENARKERENALKAELLANEAKWQMLRYQVNPHFFFNSLNSIMALINEDTKLARSVVNELSSYFRHTLSWNGTSIITINEELDAVKHYLYIQKIRFEKRLHFSFRIDKEMRDVQIPVFGLQTLVENAIKYGKKTYEGEIEIMISAYMDGVNGIIRVANSGKIYKHENDSPEDDENGTRSGLENLRGRMDLLYPENNSFRLYEDGEMVIAEIRITSIPIKQNESMADNNSG